MEGHKVVKLRFSECCDHKDYNGVRVFTNSGSLSPSYNGLNIAV